MSTGPETVLVTRPALQHAAPGTRTLQEYDGDEHLKAARRRKDLARERRLGRAGWTRRGYTAHEVLKQAAGILRDADAFVVDGDSPTSPTE